MAETVKIEETLTAEEMAQKCAELQSKGSALENDLAEAKEVVFSIERAEFSGEKIDPKKYRSARTRQGDLESRQVAIGRMLENTMAEGARVLADEVKASAHDLNAERVQLNAQKAKAIKGPVLTALVKYFHEREKATGMTFTLNDAGVPHALPGDTHANTRFVRAELERLGNKMDMSKTIGGRLKSINKDLDQVRDGRIPDFAQLVSEAQKGV